MKYYEMNGNFDVYIHKLTKQRVAKMHLIPCTRSLEIKCLLSGQIVKIGVTNFNKNYERSIIE
jgi:diketogulonate reductase-like aldo/keto reductase